MIGPHFWFDLIRLPRKGWSTFFRALYLVVLLAGLGAMYEARRRTIVNAASYASFVHTFAYTLIVLQDVLILVLIPVYVGSAVAEERENQTLEALFVTPLTDRQIVNGKFYSRLLHLLLLILAGFPLLAFTHLWGNVSIALLLFHTLNTMLLAMSASSICINVSCKSDTVFGAVTSSYPPVLLLAMLNQFVVYGCFSLPGWNSLSVYAEAFAYASGLAFLAFCHLANVRASLGSAIYEMNHLRNLENKPKQRQQSRAFSLKDTKPQPICRRQGKIIGSYIHHLALPIREPAMFWKECLKDGTTWSLTYSWLLSFVLAIVSICMVSQLLIFPSESRDFQDVRILTGSLAYTAYFVALAAYFLVVVFQTTVAVAGERERNTLEFLLLLPIDRREIIFCKWLGPLWKNWPLLAISYLGVLLGLGTQVFSPATALVLILIPWPGLLMCSFVGLLLSVFFRRTLYANIVIAGFLLMLFVVHLLGYHYLEGLFPAYGWLLFEADRNELASQPVTVGIPLVLAEQVLFLSAALMCGGLAYLRFMRTDYQGKM